MGYRLSKIYTRTGDQGSTGLGDGRRVEKDCARIEAIGTIDELNSLVGILIAEKIPGDIGQILTQVQHHLFDLGGELAIPGHHVLTDETTRYLEQRLDEINSDLPPLREFILPGGNRLTASCHHARTVCRRAERRLLHLGRQQDEEVNSAALKYLNRLSDLLFVIARKLARIDGGEEIYWKRQDS
jgi:cob(I)alamin adenosyltransferase